MRFLWKNDKIVLLFLWKNDKNTLRFLWKNDKIAFFFIWKNDKCLRKSQKNSIFINCLYLLYSVYTIGIRRVYQKYTGSIPNSGDQDIFG